MMSIVFSLRSFHFENDTIFGIVEPSGLKVVKAVRLDGQDVGVDQLQLARKLFFGNAKISTINNRKNNKKREKRQTLNMSPMAATSSAGEAAPMPAPSSSSPEARNAIAGSATLRPDIEPMLTN